MNLQYIAEYKCSFCGIFTMNKQKNIHETVDCPKCHRTSDFVGGTVTRLPEGKPRQVPKSQKRLSNE
jgi:hypothetical protein